MSGVQLSTVNAASVARMSAPGPLHFLKWVFVTVKLIFINEHTKKKIGGRMLLAASFVLFQTFLLFWKHLHKHCSFGTSAHKLMQILDFFGHEAMLTRVTLCLIPTEKSVNV